MRNETGFTVLELVFVIAIGFILGAVATHVISSRIPGQHLNGAAQALRSDLNNAKIQALKNGVQYQVTVTVSSNSYQFWQGTTASGAAFPSATETKTLPYSDITLSGGPIVFDPRGTVSTATPITLKNSEDNTRTISVSLAGRIRSI